MADSAKSLTSLVLLVLTTTLFAVGWSGDAHAQRRLAAEWADQAARRTSPSSPTREPAPLPQSARASRELTRTVDTSPLARLSPGRYRMTDTAGRVATFVIDSNYSSGLPPRHRVALMNIDGVAMALVREEPVADRATDGQTALR